MTKYIISTKKQLSSEKKGRWLENLQHNWLGSGRSQASGASNSDHIDKSNFGYSEHDFSAFVVESSLRKTLGCKFILVGSSELTQSNEVKLCFLISSNCLIVNWSGLVQKKRSPLLVISNCNLIKQCAVGPRSTVIQNLDFHSEIFAVCMIYFSKSIS